MHGLDFFKSLPFPGWSWIDAMINFLLLTYYFSVNMSQHNQKSDEELTLETAAF